MRREQVVDLIKELSGPNTLMVHVGEWVSFPCMFAPWKHTTGHDEHPSAGISVSDNGVSIYNCFACHSKGRLSWVVRELESLTGEDYGALSYGLEQEEFYGAGLPEWGEEVPGLLPLEPIDKAFHFDLYDSACGHPYLRKRGITDHAARVMELLYDPGDGGARRIVFPVYGPNKLLYGFTGRAIDRDVSLKVKDYFGLPKKRLLLGAHLVLPEDEYVILVEGLFDYAKLVTFGQPVMAFMSSTLTAEQAEIVKDFGKPVYFFHDNDEPGLDARSKAKEILCKHVPTMKVRYPDECTIETPEGDLRPPNDPAELTQLQVEEMLSDARLL